MVIGEAAKAALEADLSLETEIREFKWSPIAKMRDRLTHHYWRTDNNIVWSTASKSVPELKEILEGALQRLEARTGPKCRRIPRSRPVAVT